MDSVSSHFVSTSVPAHVRLSLFRLVRPVVPPKDNSMNVHLIRSGLF